MYTTPYDPLRCPYTSQTSKKGPPLTPQAKVPHTLLKPHKNEPLGSPYTFQTTYKWSLWPPKVPIDFPCPAIYYIVVSKWLIGPFHRLLEYFHVLSMKMFASLALASGSHFRPRSDLCTTENNDSKLSTWTKKSHSGKMAEPAVLHSSSKHTMCTVKGST